GLGLIVGAALVGGLLGRPELLSTGMLVALPAMLAAGYVSHAYQLASLLMFTLKVTTLVFVIIWIRWTLPRFRVDQMMNMCWKYFIPISFACFVLQTGWVWLADGTPALQ